MASARCGAHEETCRIRFGRHCVRARRKTIPRTHLLGPGDGARSDWTAGSEALGERLQSITGS